jgi:hypothetical protein
MRLREGPFVVDRFKTGTPRASTAAASTIRG